MMHDDNCERHDFAVGDFPLKDCSCRLRARLSKAEALLARIDNSDAIIIDRDMTTPMVKRHTLLAHDSFPDLPAEVVAASDYDDLSARLAEAEAENARLVSANKARDEFLRGHRYKRSEMDVYVDLCESQMAEIKARLAEAERDAARFKWWFDPNNDAAEFMTLPIDEGSVDDWRAAIDAAMGERP